MERISCTPRENYREIVEKQGFGFHESYWMEDACYCFTSAEIEALEKATAECYEMYCKAVEACLYDNRRLDALCIPATVREAIVRSWEEDDYSLYGRFDFAFVNGVPKLLEFNADTPTSLVEAAVIQWLWKEDVFPSHDQFNSIHEKMVESWKYIHERYQCGRYYFASISDCLEDNATLGYIISTAFEAGLVPYELDIRSIRHENGSLFAPDGGLIVLHSGGIMSGITKITDGILNVAGTNNISDLELKNALVTIIKEPGFSQLQIDKLDGSGIFSISSNLAQSEADHLDIGGSNGNFGLIVHDYSADGNLPAEFKLIDETSSAADNFYLVGNAVDVGAFRYNLQHDGDDWVLHRTQEHTDSSLIAQNTYSSLASLFYTHLSPLYNRFRMKHKRTGKDDGLWIKGIGREIKFRYKDQTKSNMKIYGAEIGYDREIWHNGGKGLQLGLYGGTSDSRQKYDRGGHGDGETQSLGVYSTLSTADNWFVDVVGTYFWHTQKIKSYTPSGSDVNGKYDANAWQVSAFVGKRWDIAESWFVEPYMGLNYMRVDGIDYRTNFNTRVSASAADYLGGSIGVSGGKEFVLADGTVFDAYGRFSLMHDWDGKSPVTVADEIFAEDTSSLRYELGVGIAAAWNETNSAYFEASTQLGSSVRFPWEINIGIQFNF